MTSAKFFPGFKRLALYFLLGLTLGWIALTYQNLSAPLVVTASEVSVADELVNLDELSSGHLLVTKMLLQRQQADLQDTIWQKQQEKNLYQLRSDILADEIDNFRDSLLQFAQRMSRKNDDLTQRLEAIELEVLAAETTEAESPQALITVAKNQAVALGGPLNASDLFNRVIANSNALPLILAHNRTAVGLATAQTDWPKMTEAQISRAVEKLNQRHGHYLDISVLACGEQLCELQLLGKFTEAYRDYGREIIDAVKTQADLKHSLQSPIGQNSDADMQPLLMVFCRQSCTL